jgi:hypothetical protein
LGERARPYWRYCGLAECQRARRRLAARDWYYRGDNSARVMENTKRYRAVHGPVDQKKYRKSKNAWWRERYRTDPAFRAADRAKKKAARDRERTQQRPPKACPYCGRMFQPKQLRSKSCQRRECKRALYRDQLREWRAQKANSR